MSDSLKYWVVIPAAGEGLRMGVDKPKQYISINNKTLLSILLIALFIVKKLKNYCSNIKGR